MKASEIELSRVDAECLTQMPADGSIGVGQVAPLARAFLHLHGILSAPLPDDLAAIEARAAKCARLVDVQDSPGVTLASDDAYAIGDVLAADVPCLLTGIRAQAATIEERDAEVARLDRLAKAERAYRVALCDRATNESSMYAVASASEDLRAAGGVP